MKKVFIITGANRGLGKAFVDILIQNNENFIISISRKASAVQTSYSSDVFRLISADLSENDLGDKLSVLKDLITNQDIYFFNNAGIIEPITEIENLEFKAVDDSISVNITSTIRVTQYLLNHFPNNKLSFINISSGAAKNAIRNWSMYCSSKAFVKMFYEVAAIEYEQHNFYNLDPGVMDTNMQDIIRKSAFPDLNDFKEYKKAGKLRSPKEVALEILNKIS